jgi:hypothetical protein
MQKKSPISSHLMNGMDSAFQNLLQVGEKIERVTHQIKTEIEHQKNKSELVFLQKLKPKITTLAKLYQEELICIEIIKNAEPDDVHKKTQIPLPLFVLEERAWRKFNLVNPWSELKLQSQTLLDLAIDYEIEQQKLSNEINKDSWLKETIESWKKELYLLGFSVQYKIKKKINPQEFDSLLNTFSEQSKAINRHLNAASKQQIKKNNAVNSSSNQVTIQIDDVEAIDKFVQEMEGFSQELDSLTETIIPLRSIEKKKPKNIDLTDIDEEISQILNPLQRNINEQRILQIENEIFDYFEKMNVVVKSSLSCDSRLLEYLLVRVKDITKLLIEKDFLLQDDANRYDGKLENFIKEHLAEKMSLFLVELLEPIKKTILENIDKENNEISLYNKKYKKNRPMKTMSEHEWFIFRKKLLDATFT